MIRALAVLFILLSLAGCTTVSEVRPNERVVINGSLSVEPPQSWSQVTTFSVYGAQVVVWTKDGAELNKLCFVGGLEDNTSIHADRPGKPPEPKFRSNMTPSEVMELFDAAYSRPVSTPVIFNTANLRPAKFAGIDGFRFDFSFVDQADEVERKGIAVGTIHKGKLYLLFYHGARIHYFGKNLQEVEQIIGSAKLLGRPRGSIIATPTQRRSTWDSSIRSCGKRPGRWPATREHSPG